VNTAQLDPLESLHPECAREQVAPSVNPWKQRWVCVPVYTGAVNAEGSDFYNVPQAARILRVTPERVLKLINEGDLKATPSQQAGGWIVEAPSVHARLKGRVPQEQEPEAMSTMTTSPSSESPHQESRFFDLDLLILLIIGTITLLAAVYALLPTLLGGEESTQPPEETTVGATTQTTQPENTSETSATTLEKTAPPPTVAPAGWVSAVGDSVMLGAVDALQEKIPSLGLLNAQGSRQPPAAIDTLRQMRAANHLGDAVVVHIGNNGPFTDEQFDEMMQPLVDMSKVLIVNLTVPSDVPGPVAIPNNAVLARGVQRYPNTMLVDWQAASANHPEFFGEDGIHLTLEGAQAYADLIASYLGDTEHSPAPPGPQERISWGEGGSFGECVGPSSWCIVP
jgi:hypothetical protein